LPLGHTADWDFALLLTLLAFSIVSDVGAVETGASVKISGSFLALVLAMVFLGGPPAALIGVVTIAVGWLRWRDSASDFLINLVTYAWFPLAGGLAFSAATDAAALDPNDGFFYVMVVGVFALALSINFSTIAIYGKHVERTPFFSQVRKALLPVLSSVAARSGRRCAPRSCRCCLRSWRRR
jgi:hypothetical protein